MDQEWVFYRWPLSLTSLAVGGLTFQRRGDLLGLLVGQVERYERALLAAGFERVEE